MVARVFEHEATSMTGECVVAAVDKVLTVGVLIETRVECGGGGGVVVVDHVVVLVVAVVVLLME